MSDRNDSPPVFALLALPESSPGAIYSLYEVFLSVGAGWEQITGIRSEVRRIEPRIVAPGGAPVEASFGVSIVPHAALCEADVVIVGDIAIDGTFDPVGRWKEEVAWIRQCHRQGAIICSICTGAIVLAEAGILDGYEATSHWSAVEILRENYPRIRLQPQRILTTAGPGDQIVTGGGATAWEDMALYLVARFSGGQEAVRISKIFLLGDHADGQLPFAGARPARRHGDAVIASVQGWIGENYHLANPVARMIGQSGLNERTFLRRFRAATGYSAMDYVQTLRIEEAKHMLETTGLPVDTIAVEIGYEEPNFFRRLFKRKVGITPARYRQKFSRIAFLPNRPRAEA